MSNRMRFVLDGDDRLTPVLNRAGDGAVRLHRRLDDSTSRSSASLRAFTRDADGQLRSLQGRFVSVAQAARLIQDSNGRWRDLNGRFISSEVAARRMAAVTNGLPSALRAAGDAAGGAATRMRQLNDDTDSAGRTITRVTGDVNGRLRDAQGRFLGAGGAAGGLGDAAEAAGGKVGGMGGALGGLAAVIGLSLLPALGALAPMLAGAGLAAGTLKLGFAGVGDAVAAAGKSKKEYQKELKKLSPEARSFTKELVGMKKEFADVGRDVQKAMLPGFTKALKAADPVVKIVGRGMTELGGAFGKAAEGAGRLFKDSGFQKDLEANLTLGRQFVGDMMSGLGGLGRGFLSFGAASKPTLTALSGGIRDLLGQGLPGMFDGLKVGIEGSSKFLNGLFGMINRLLPAIGRFSGEVARSLGPLLGEMFTSLGVRGAGALDTLGQVVKGLTPVFKDLGFGLKTTTQLMQIIGPTVRDTAGAIVGSLLPSFSQVDQAQGPLQRLSGWVQDNKGAIQEFARQGATGFITLVQAGVTHLPTLIKIFRLVTGGMVTALGGVLHAAAEAFGWIPGIGGKLKSADEKFQSFKESYLSGLQTAEDKARGFAESVVPKLSAGKLKLNIENWQSQIETAKAKMKTVPPSKRAKLQATIDDLQAKVSQAKGALASIQDKTVTVTTFLTYKGKSMAAVSAGRMATGGPVGFPGGGAVRGPGTSTSDSIPAMLSDGEYVINARSTAKYRSLIEAINTDRLGVAGLGGAGTAVAQGLAGGMTASFGLVEGGARRMASAVVAGIRAELEIASPSKKTAALAKDIGAGLIKGLTGSRDKIKATAKDLAADIWKAFDGRKDNRLVAMVNRQTKRLLGLAAQRDKLAEKIKAAKDYASGVTSTARQQAGLASLGMAEGEVTAGGIKGGLTSKLEQIRKFTGYIKELAKRGLNKGLLRQILDMGPEQGYAYASALAGADKATFNEINSLQKKIDTDTRSLGRIGADRLYDSGKNAGRGFLKGLESQQDAIEKLMVKIAKGMEKAIRRALGIKSPSTVMARIGAHSTEGLARGLVGGMPALDEALAAVSGRVADTQPVIGRPAVAGAGARQVNVQVDVHGAIDPVATAREIRRMLLELKRVHGININLGVG
ncbi:hypothetical protein HW846_46370 [Streptomyces sp. NE06-02F]|uniref:hypothetical protein n=1 Tax=Streptomyces caniscabiei TaxID=2746961 RepID=UPI001872F61F|nr:hypothetical protein [Streptomyces caniscabiei]MBE4790672.1 hypothetical protein [Streptomyces caniscabiei]MDX2941036.1 hypothetical protein [Streptomyces caniscabiei]